MTDILDQALALLPYLVGLLVSGVIIFAFGVHVGVKLAPDVRAEDEKRRAVEMMHRRESQR